MPSFGITVRIVRFVIFVTFDYAINSSRCIRLIKCFLPIRDDCIRFSFIHLLSVTCVIFNNALASVIVSNSFPTSIGKFTVVLIFPVILDSTFAIANFSSLAVSLYCLALHICEQYFVFVVLAINLQLQNWQILSMRILLLIVFGCFIHTFP